MKITYSFLSLFCLLIGQVSAQTYADDVAQIVFDNCTSCHHAGGIAPFSLMAYSDVSAYASTIQTEVNNGSMPPWSPNNNYSEFSHTRSLSAAEITTINDWVNAGAPQGNPANTPATPVYDPNNWELGPPDMSIRIPDYVSKATFGNDDYVCFSIPTNMVTSEVIQAIEVIPGNAAVVHHALIYIDANNTYGTDTTSHNCGGPTNLPLIAGFAPGSSPAQFPDVDGFLKMGINLPANSRIIFAMHYPEGSQGILDSTRINFHFYPQGASNVRQVSANPILNDYSFNINANTVDSVDAWFPSASLPVSSDLTLFSVFPHAHLLGKSFIVYAVNHSPPYDRIPLIHIPEWDFDWQGFYVFKYLQKLPVGYKLYGKAIYDNTTNNPFNPNNPPQNVSFGLNTTDEMFLVYFQYMPYEVGDELINVDSLLQLQVPTGTQGPIALNEGGLFLTSYPNPSDDLTMLQYYLENTSEVSLGIYDLQGKLVKQIITESTLKGEHYTSWDGTNTAGAKVPSGVYISQLQVNGKTVTNKIIRN